VQLRPDPGEQLAEHPGAYLTRGTGQPLSRRFREHIFEPLGMTDTDLTRSDRIRARPATGYALRAGGPRPVRDCDLVPVGAGAIYSTTADMAR
jgi:CubicO group peptidase (beta-lactamase class C family)